MAAHNLDLPALRAFIAIVDRGGVTRAAEALNLTQSAVSMQLKRLEEVLCCPLFDRVGRQMILTGAGEQLLGYARRIIATNDEAVTRLTHASYEGELTLGVPDDIIYPRIPAVLKRFAALFPRVRVQLVASISRNLRADLARGRCDIILTTEKGMPSGAETLTTMRLVWLGATGGSAWRGRPVRLGFEAGSAFRTEAVAALDAAGIPWEIAIEAGESRTVEVSVAADLGVVVWLEGTEPPGLSPVPADAGLPVLPPTRINLYGANSTAPGAAALCDLLREAYRGPSGPG